MREDPYPWLAPALVLATAVVLAGVGLSRLGGRTVTGPPPGRGDRNAEGVARSPLRFTVASPPREVLDAIVAALGPRPSAPTGPPGLYLKGSAPDAALLALGDREGDVLVLQLTVTSPDGTVTQGVLETLAWRRPRRSDDVAQALALRGQIANTVTGLGGTVHAAPPPLR